MARKQAKFMIEDLNQARNDTPGLSSRIHLDNCGSSLMTRPVVDAMSAYLEREACMGGYVAQEQQSKALLDVYVSLTELFGGCVDDYALTSSAVEAWAKAFYSIPMRPGDNIVTMYNDYCSNYVSCLQRVEREGVELRVAHADENGCLDLDHFKSLIDNKTKVASITHVPSSCGLVTDVFAVGEILRDSNAFYLLDACQAVGQMNVNFEAIGCHMAAATSRKFLRGPRGVGFLYVNEEARGQIEPAMLSNYSATWDKVSSYTLQKSAKMFEDWERSCMLHLGFGAALKYLKSIGTEKVYRQTALNAAGLRKAIYELPNVAPACSPNADAAIITFNVKGHEASAVRALLARHDIAVQVSTAFHTRYDYETRGLTSAVRVSPHYYNDQSEFDRFLNILGDI